MNLDESKAYLASANLARPFGLSWGKIEAMQGGKLRHDRRKPAKTAVGTRKCASCGNPTNSTCFLPLCKPCSP